MRNKILLSFVLVIVFLLSIGCEDKLIRLDASLDQEAIENYILDNEEKFFSITAHYGAEDTLSANDIGTISDPKTWWREPLDVNRQISINIVNDSAFVTISLRNDGVFHILEIDTSAATDSVIHYQKDLGDNLLSYAIFKRYDGATSHRGWRLESVTGAEVNSDSVEVAIDSVRINCESYEDTVLTDPWVFFERGDILTFGAEEEVYLTLYSSYDVYAYFHAKSRGDHWRRWKFTETKTTGVWGEVWIASSVSGVKVAAFDVLNKYTLDNETYSYDSNAWIFPYRVE